MATSRNKRKLATVTRETQEEHPRNGQSRNTSIINEEYITQVIEEIAGRVTKKLSQEFSRTESRILGALSKLDEFLLNPQIRTHSGTVPGTYRNTNVENQEPNEDHSQDDPHPEVGPSVCKSRHSIDSDTDEVPHNMTTKPFNKLFLRLPIIQNRNLGRHGFGETSLSNCKNLNKKLVTSFLQSHEIRSGFSKTAEC